MPDLWDERDRVLHLREAFAKLVAAKVSGISPGEVSANNDDLLMADRIAELIEKEYS